MEEGLGSEAKAGGKAPEGRGTVGDSTDIPGFQAVGAGTAEWPLEEGDGNRGGAGPLQVRFW